MKRVGGSPKDQQMPFPPISGDVIFNQNSDMPVDHDRCQSKLTATGILPDNYNLTCRKTQTRSTLTLQNDFRLELDGSRLTRSHFCFLKKGKKEGHLFRSHQINLPARSSRMLWEPISRLIVIHHDLRLNPSFLQIRNHPNCSSLFVIAFILLVLRNWSVKCKWMESNVWKQISLNSTRLGKCQPWKSSRLHTVS